MADLVISTLEELKSFRDEVNAGNTFAGKTVELAANIDLMSEEWTPIGNNTNKFQGTFDGKGYTVSNLVITGNNSNAGFFGFTESGAIKNLTIDNASVSGYLNVGVVAGTPYTSTYSNIKLTGVIKVDGYAYVGGMFGKNLYADASDLVIEASDDSYVKASSEFYRTYVGGIVGFMGEGPHTVQNVTSNINVEGSTCDVGGIAGIAHYENIFINVTCTAKKVVLVNAQDEGDHLEVGGIAGVWHNDSGRTVQMINCNVEGTELKSSLNGVEQDVSGNITTGRQYNASSTGSLLVGNQTSSDEMTWTVSGPNAQTDLANLLGMDPSELIADEKGNYTVQASIDTSVLYVNSAWTGTADGQFVTTPDGVKLRFGTNAFGSFQTLTSLYGSKDSSNTETQKISFIGNDTYSGNAKQFLYTGRDLLLTTDDAGGATIEWTVPRLYLMNVYSIVNGQGAPDPAQMPTVTIGKDVSLVINPASGNDGILMVGQNIDSPDDLDADGNPTRDPGAINLVIDGTVTARLYIANYSNVTVSNTGKVFKGKEAFIMRGKSTMSVTGNNDGAAQLTANYTQMSGGTLTLTDTRMETGRFSLSYDAKSLEGAREGATLNMANSTVAGSGDLIIDAQSKVTATDNSLLSLKNSVDNSGILSLESGSSLVAASAVNAGTVSIDGSSLNVKTVTNNGSISVTGNSKLNIESLTGNVNLVDGANLSDSVIGSGTVVTTGNVTLSGNVTLDKFNAVDGEGDAGNSVTIAAGADVRLNGEVRIRTNDVVHIYGALTVGDAADFYKKNGSEMTIYKDGVLTLEDSSFQNNSLLTVYGEMNLNYVNGWAPKLAGNETGKYSGQLVVDGKDGKGIVNVKAPFLTFGGGLGSAWKEAADGCTVDILNNGKIVTDAKAFWNSSKNTLTLNHGSLIFDAANSAYDSVWQADAKFDNDGVMSGSNSSVIDMSGRTFTNNGSVTLADSTLTAGTLVNNNIVNVSGNSKISAAVTGELSVKDGAVLATDGLTGTGHLVIDEGATATLSGNGFDFNGYIYGATNKYNQEGVTGFTLNIENAENFSNSALYASNGSRYNLMNSKVETTTLNVNATGKVSVDKDSSVSAETAHILGALETSGELVVDIFNIYAGLGADDAAGQVSLKNGSVATVYRQLNIGTSNRSDAKYNATATGADEKIAKLDLDNATLKFVAIVGEVPHFYVGSDSSAGQLTATESSIELGENQAVDFKVGTQGTVVLSDTSFTLLRNSTFTNNGTITTDYASTITVGGTFTNSGTITVDMAGAAANGVYKLIDNTGTTTMTLADYGTVTAVNNTLGYTFSVINNDLYALNADMTTLKVDAAWAGSEFGAKVAEGYYYGINAFSSVQNAADAVTAAVQTINVTDAVYDTTKFTKSVNLTGTATFDLTKSESFMFFTDGVSAASYEIASGTVITAPSLSLRAEDASENYVDGLTVSVLCNGTVNLSGASASDAAREIWVRKNTTLTVAEGGSVNGATQLSNRGTININGVISGISMQGNGAMMLAGQQNSNGTFTGGVMNINGGELSVSGVRTISGGNSLMITDKNATAASEKGIVNLTNGGKITAADSEMYIGLSGELNIGEAASVTVSKIENNGVINVTGSGILSAAVAKGKLNFGTAQEKVNTTYDVTNQGAGEVSVQNGEVTFTGIMADDNIRIQPLNVGRYDTDYAGGILNIGSAADKTASVNAHQVYIAENESVNEHTLNVYGNLDVYTSIYNKAKGNLNVYGTVSADYMQVAGKTAVTGADAGLTLAGAGSNGSFKIGTDVSGLRGQMVISDHATVDAGGIAYVGYSDGTRVGDLMLSDHARLNAVAISIDAGSTVVMDYTSTVAFETITNHGTITVDTAGFSSGVYKIFDDLTGSYTETEYRSLLGDANWNKSYQVIDYDLYLTNLEGAELYVDSAWASMSPNEEVTFVDGTKAYYKLNAFDTVANALALPTGETAYENAVKLNITGAVKSNISVIGSNIMEVNSAAKTADENAVIAEDALTVNLVQVDNTEAGWEVYYPLAAGSAASVYGGITTNFVSGLFTFETTRDPNIIGGAYGASDAKIYGSTTLNIGTDGGSDSDVDIYVDALVGSGGGTINGNSSVNIYSGTIERTGSIIGGSSWGGVVKGDSSVNIYGGNLIDSSDGKSKRGIMGGSYNGVTEGNASVNIYGGTVNGRIYAGGSQAGTTVKGNASVNISDGVVNGSIYGTGGVVEGSISISVTGGTIKGNIYAGGLNVGVAGTKTVNISDYSNPDKDNKNHFYGGSSVTQSGTADALLEIVDGDVIMNVADTEAYADIFGGASVTKSNYVFVEAGSSDVTVKNLLINGYDSGKTIWTGRVYGAGQISNSGNSSVDNYDVYYQASSNVHVTNIGGITVNKDDGSVTHNPGARVYGGGYLYWSRKSELTVGSTNVVVDEDLQKDSDVKTELAHVIGGSLISGTIDGVNASTIITGNTDVTVNAGVISAWLVGGNNSNWFGRSVIGVADENGAYEYNGEKYSAGSTKVTLNDGGSETLSIIGGSLTDYASYYEAGRLREAVVFGKTEIIMNGGTAYEAVGGGYALYQNQNADTSGKLTGVENPLSNVEGETNVTVNGGTIKSNVIGGGYAYSNQAASLSSIANVTGNTFVAIGGTAAVEGNVYGGGYADGGEADVTGNTSVNVTGGTVAGNIYGGGYHANVNGNATVTITGGTVSGDIYGSGEGEATVNGSRTLNLGSADAAAYAATLNNVYDFNVAQIVNADVTVTGDFSVEEITIAGATLTLNSGFLAATTAVAIEVGAYNVTAAALNVGVSGVNQPSITISAAEELTAGRYLVASGFDSLSGFTVDGINDYTLRLQGEDVYLTKDLAPDDYDANGRPDILMQHDIGKLQVSLVQEDQSVILKDVADLGDGWTILGSGQSGNGENYADIYLTNGETVGIWQLDETTGVTAWQEIQSFDSATHVLGLGDFNGDGITDLLLQNDNGAVGAYLTDGENVGWNYFQSLGSEWSIAGIGDFNHDGIDDVVLQNEQGGYAGIWQLDRDGQVSWSDLDVLNNGQIAGTGDFNGDGFDDVLLKWGNSYGAWTVSGGNLSGWMDLGTLWDSAALEQIGDFNGDGIDDLRVRITNGDLGAFCVLGEGNLQWNYHFSVGSEWQTNLVSI